MSNQNHENYSLSWIQRAVARLLRRINGAYSGTFGISKAFSARHPERRRRLYVVVPRFLTGSAYETANMVRLALGAVVKRWNNNLQSLTVRRNWLHLDCALSYGPAGAFIGNDSTMQTITIGDGTLSRQRRRSRVPDADDFGNLWPESYETVLSAHVKDRLEDRLDALVVRGKVDLKTAQREIAEDWIAAYRKYIGPSCSLTYA